MKSFALTLLTLACSLTLQVQARLGETPAQSQTRYGPPREDLKAVTDEPLLRGAVEHCYEYSGWRIRAAFAGGNCVKIEYVHMPEDGQLKKIQPKEIDAILEAEKGRGRWKEAKQKVAWPYQQVEKDIRKAFNVQEWERTDDAKAKLALGIVLTLASRDADDWAKRFEKTARNPAANVPKF
jgi:hypothetical protein